MPPDGDETDDTVGYCTSAYERSGAIVDRRSSTVERTFVQFASVLTAPVAASW